MDQTESVSHPVDRFPPTPPKSHVDAIEQKELYDLVNGHSLYIDEDAIKETPPRLSNEPSSPRSLGEVLSHDDNAYSLPATPTISRKPYAGLSHGDATSPAVPISELGDHNDHLDVDRRLDSGSEGSPRSPLRRVKKRIPSNTLDGGSREINSSMESKVFKESHDGRNGEARVSLTRPAKGQQETPMDLLDAEKEQVEDADKEDAEQASLHSRTQLVSGRGGRDGRQTSHLRWAPLKLPLERRLQTLMVLCHTLSPIISASLFCFLCAVPLFWPIILPYLIFILNSKAATSGTLNYRSERFRNSSMWEYFAGYFPATLHRTAELPPTRKYIFGYHPHGIISHGAFAAFATEALGFSTLFPGITNTLLTLDSNFRIPLHRDWILRLGLASVDRTSCENLLSKGGPNNEGMGRAITIVVGGARESLDSVPERVRLVLNCRKGFVKMAVRTGADLVPVFAFGENELYEQVDSSAHPWIHKGQMLVKRVAGFTVPLFHARGVFNYDVGLLPYRRPVNIVVGKPILVQAMKHPTPEYVDEIHQRYVDELLGIWETWKDRYGGASTGLDIIE